MRIFVTSTLLVACTGSPTEAPTPSAPTAPAANAAEPQPGEAVATADANPDAAPTPAPGTGLCAADETSFFHCAAAGDKHVSLCGASDASWLQYRFGAPAKVELTFPTDRDGSAAAFRYAEETYIRSTGDTVWFENDGYKYVIKSMVGGGGGPDAEANNFHGVEVHKGDKLVATVSCATDVEESLATLRGKIGD